jgi:hypothetical protein
MHALQFSKVGPVANLRLVDLPACKADSASAIDRVIALSDGRAAYEEEDRGQVHGRLVLAP